MMDTDNLDAKQAMDELTSQCYTSFTRQGGNVYPESETEQALRAEIAALQDNAEIGEEYVKAVLKANPNVMWSESPVEIFREMAAENARLTAQVVAARKFIRECCQVCAGAEWGMCPFGRKLDRQKAGAKKRASNSCEASMMD